MSRFHGSRKRLAKIAGILLVVVSLGWVTWLMRDAWGSLSSLGAYANYPRLAGTFILLAFSMYLASPSFLRILEAVTRREISWREFAHLYFVSQLMKHLPGRFLGVVYQAVSARHIATPVQWTSVNAAYMIMSMGGSLAISLVVLTLAGEVNRGLALCVLISILGGGIVLRRIPKFVLDGTSRWRRVLHAGVQAACAVTRARVAAVIIAWYSASWVVYLAAWGLLATSMGVGVRAGIELCALYTISWTIGFLAVVTPSGLGVRELAFVTLASQYPADLVVFVAIVARVGMLTADLGIGLVHMLWERVR